MAETVELIQNHSPSNKINKVLETVATIEGVQQESSDSVHPKLRIRTGGVGTWVNYFKWRSLYYFLDSEEQDTGNIAYLNGTIDALTSYADEVMNMHGFAARATTASNSAAPDELRVISARADRVVYNFPGPISRDMKDGVYIMVTSKGHF